MAEWQTMESAWTDGRVILAYRKDAGMFEAHFVSPAEMDAGDDEERRWFTTYGEDLTRDLPTHWMPRLEPPETKP